MDLQLTGRRALVTGSSSGLGEAIALLLAKEGADVVVHGRDEARTRAVAEKVGAQAVAVGDLATDEGADAVAAVAGDVDVLVNNAGAYDHLGWADSTPEVWLRTYDVNVVSGVRMIHRFVPGMRARGWGRVIQIGGGLSGQPMAMQPHYNATLAARHNLAVSLARDLKGTGVTSNVVAPGAILVDSVQRLLTEMAPERGWGADWVEIERNAAEDFVPNDVGRFGRPGEIAGAVAYLASPYADYVSGATLRVDGGTIRSVQ
ncbi:SDR family NAD(P)-dependent oxidoreductase [Amycolatopsis sp. SID8362]|uniref:SDR family NAD(P)-dependent oxidoreductase n=1 Tax=Amycolatopsis sp. SID8362 TaxID=2690346 RepID=UPI0013695FD5|nr:SDR family NAD(P)-dependent oxidoreductase [Amycolatopsis sp. SID8362]NBH07409.1 SDR family NAD(P)-dependent oxidoreductase [Amycolatopsis sp. SID8362]NED44105.1 SDR family NAD(P)-dependent oxidoreductase [Amycolatopsis sp. SID8362]